MAQIKYKHSVSILLYFNYYFRILLNMIML